MLTTLRSRGLLNAVTHESVGDIVRRSASPVSFYTGFDPTADGLHVGSLVQLMTMRWLQRAGLRPVALVGGASGMIGDPSGRSSERNLLTEEAVARNVDALAADIGRLIDIKPASSEPAGGTDAVLVNNMNWYGTMSAIGFLRDVGKHFRVSTMLSRDSVRSRMDADAGGISFTEFSYQALQAYDFAHLARTQGCVLQTGGSDQWGNIVGGVDLVRRMTGEEVFGLTTPLLTTSTGEKFGKSAGNAVWLSPQKTSDFAFYQYFFGQSDEDVQRLLLMLTELDEQHVQELCAEHAEAPERRSAQRALAGEVTRLVRGPSGLQLAEAATDLLFGKAPASADDAPVAALEALRGAVPYTRREAAEVVGTPVVALCTSLGITSSKAEAKRLVKAKGLTVGGRRVESESDRIRTDDVWHGRFLVLKPGKKKFFLVDFASGSARV